MQNREFYRQVAKKLDLRPPEVALLWQATQQILAETLVENDEIRLKKFGVLHLVSHKSRTVPDPRNRSQNLVVMTRRLVKFRPSEELKKLIRQPATDSTAPSGDETDQVSSAAPALDPTLDPDFKLGDDQSNDESTALEAASSSQDSESESETEVETDPETDPEVETESESETDPETAPALGHPGKASRPVNRSLTAPENIEFIELADLTIDPNTLALIPVNVARKYQIAAIEKTKTSLILAMIDPGDKEAIDFASRLTGLTVTPKLTTASDLEHAFDQYGKIETELGGDLTGEEGEPGSEDNPAKTESDESLNNNKDPEAPAAKIVNDILERAVRDKASDIHIEPEEKAVKVRFRIDGLLKPATELPKAIQAAVISRLKIMSSLKIDESRLPQDGRIRMVVDHNPIDFRLSTFPAIHGEKVVMRILDKSGGIQDFNSLGLTGRNLKRISDNSHKAHGMLLVTGPTGSGKTTTLYSILNQLMSPEVNIVTLEDPVEYRLAGINQSQVNASIGYDFAHGLRTIVRQDPDIILIGEIRDSETAMMAIHSALTGHVVLSTLHTNDAAGAIPRLIDMGIEPFLITSSTNAVVAQRLVRQLCTNCKVIDPSLKLTELPEIQTELAKMPKFAAKLGNDVNFYKGQGCAKCSQTGYRGRIGIYEVMQVTEKIKALALKRVSASRLAKQAVKEGMITMKQDGIKKALLGETSIAEVWRVTKD
ncbi:MAG: type IV pilus assembly protein PilB [Candidatus Berkelbacteria bacterium Gr01-1014_85]|uniref:Type IV pilus assembly protein PilB n=1 Tax=Candidatus Berkelbacteria bacterium Gr01-1014_85 TaxID=2017150 RepID=A0A554JAZ0_9BACT|nr:MAG: type IV pilus assembly protein PilB [Candidatus Berkelbacteria bacterium Gr01-1014_85]